MSTGLGLRLTGLLLALACAVAVAACGDDDGNGGGGGDGGPTTLRVGVIPIADVAPLYLGMKKGFFEEEQLTLKPQLAEGGAAITPAVVSGDFQIGFSNTISLLIAASQDLPVEIISQGVLGGKSEEEAWADLLVLKDGPIKEPKDLEGKTIAVNTLKNICEVTIRASLADMGVDDSTAPDLTVATYFTSKPYAEENADVVDRFVTAMEQSLEYAQSNPDAVREILGEYTQIPPEVAANIKLPQWRKDITLPTVERLSQLSLEYGLIESEPDLNELIAD